MLKALVDKPLISYCINSLRQSSKVNNIIIATTNDAIDDPIQEFCEKENILFYRGSTENVLKRFLDVSSKYDLDHFLRVCSDNPFIDVQLMNSQIESFEIENDYCSYYTSSGEPIMIKPIGMFVEAVSRRALEEASYLGRKDLKTQEHVTYFIHNNPKLFKINKLQIPDYINPELRFTVDYSEDFAIAQYILNNAANLSARTIMDLVKQDNILYDMIVKIATHKPKLY